MDKVTNQFLIIISFFLINCLNPIDFTISKPLIELETGNSTQTDIIPVHIPYNMKMLIQECEAMSISPRLIVKPLSEREDVTIKTDTMFVSQDMQNRKLKMNRKFKLGEQARFFDKKVSERDKIRQKLKVLTKKLP